LFSVMYRKTYEYTKNSMSNKSALYKQEVIVSYLVQHYALSFYVLRCLDVYFIPLAFSHRVVHFMSLTYAIFFQSFYLVLTVLSSYNGELFAS
jgi:hypothetical protein